MGAMTAPSLSYRGPGSYMPFLSTVAFFLTLDTAIAFSFFYLTIRAFSIELISWKQRLLVENITELRN